MNYDQARQNMILNQILPQKILNYDLINIMSELPRENFVAQFQKALCYSDQTLEIYENRYLLAPMIFARLVQEANIKPNETILDIGFGTGYSALIFSSLAGFVWGLEHHSSLVSRLNQFKTTSNRTNIDAVFGSLEQGWPQQAPYDVIFIEGATQQIPHILLDQLKHGGRLVLMMKKNGINFCQATIVTKTKTSWTVFHPFEAFVPTLKAFDLFNEFQL